MTQPNSAEQSANPTLKDRVKSLSLGDRAEQPNPRVGYLPWVFVVVLALACVLMGYRAYRVSGVPTDDAPRAETTKKPATGTQTPEASDTPAPSSEGEVVLQSKGYVVPISLKQISPRVGGVLLKINTSVFYEGAYVETGTILAELDEEEYQHEEKAARAALLAAEKRHVDLKRSLDEEIKQAKLEIDEVKANAQQMKLDVERNGRLRGAAIAERELEQMLYGYRAMVAKQRRLESNLAMLSGPQGRLKMRAEAARYDMEQAKARLHTAEMRLGWCKVRAPISGTILTKKAEQYNLVNPSAFSSGISASLCEMADLRELEVDLSIQERDIPLVFEGQKCEVMPEAYQNDKKFLKLHPRGYKGVVSRLMPTADRAKGAIPVRVKIMDIPVDEARGKFLRPEMGALVSFQGGGELVRTGK
jgi:multidrug resistance efflux pump